MHKGDPTQSGLAETGQCWNAFATQYLLPLVSVLKHSAPQSSRKTVLKKENAPLPALTSRLERSMKGVFPGMRIEMGFGCLTVRPLLAWKAVTRNPLGVQGTEMPPHSWLDLNLYATLGKGCVFCRPQNWKLLWLMAFQGGRARVRAEVDLNKVQCSFHDVT